MQEILTLNVGTTGCFLGNAFYKGLAQDIVITDDGSYKSRMQWDSYDHIMRDSAVVYFNEFANTKWSPRSIFINTNTSLLNAIKSSNLSSLYNNFDQQFISQDLASNTTQNTFANAYHHQFKQLNANNAITDNIRKYVEQCDRLQGFQFQNNIGGGSGSGITSKILQHFEAQYPTKMTTLFSVFPSTKLHDSTMSPFNAYNTVLGINQLLNYPCQVIPFDNDAVYRILTKCCNHDNIYYEDHNQNKYVYYNNFNDIITYGILQSTVPFRFPCKLNETMRRMSINLLPFPRLKFFSLSVAPWWNMTNLNGAQFKKCINAETYSDKLFQAFMNSIVRSLNLLKLHIPVEVINICQAYYATYYEDIEWNENGLNYMGAARIKLTVQDLTDQIWSTRHCLSDIGSFDDGKFMLGSIIYRGYMATPEVDDEVAKIQQKMADDFVTWLPNNIKSQICVISDHGCPMVATLMANNTAMKQVISKHVRAFDKCYKRQDGLQYYMDHGMETQEFDEARQDLSDLIQEYVDKQDAVVDLEDDESEYEYTEDEEESDDESEDEEEDMRTFRRSNSV